MAIIGKTFDAQLVSAGDDGALYRSLANKNDMIIPAGSGALLSISDNVLTIEECYLLICGRFIRIASGTEIDLGTILSTHAKGRVIIRLDMTKLASLSDLFQIETEVETQLSGYAYRSLVQNNVNSINGQTSNVYEAVLCTFTCTSGTASDPVIALNTSAKNTAQRPTQYNASVVAQFLAVLQTYYDNRSSLYYDNKTALNVTMNTSGGKYGIDCSTFVLLGLKGVPYSDSRYVNQGDRDDNYSAYSWGMDIYSGRTKNISAVAEYYRYAQDVARWCWDNDLIYQPDPSFSNCKIGDLMFWVSDDDVDNEDLEATISGVTHIAVFTGLSGADVTYIDANTGRTYVVDTNTKAPSTLSKVRYLGAFPVLNELTESKEITGRGYLTNNASLSNSGYAPITLSELDGRNYTNVMELSTGKLKINRSGKYLISGQLKVNSSTTFVQWRIGVYNSAGTLLDNITEGSLGAFTDIGAGKHNGYANVSVSRWINAGESIALLTAGTCTLMNAVNGTYLEVSKL